MKYLRLLLITYSGILLAGCFSPDSDVAKSKDGTVSGKGGMVSVSVDVVSYNHNLSYSFVMSDLNIANQDPVNVGVVWPLASGGSKVCCIKIPKVWRPNLKVLLEWDEGDYRNNANNFEQEVKLPSFKREIEIPPYKEPGDLYVVFNTDHTVELVVSPAEPGSPKWAGKIKETPMARCYATIGRKECRRWIFDPKTRAHQLCLDLPEEKSCSEIMEYCKKIQMMTITAYKNMMTNSHFDCFQFIDSQLEFGCRNKSLDLCQGK